MHLVARCALAAAALAAPACGRLGFEAVANGGPGDAAAGDGAGAADAPPRPGVAFVTSVSHPATFGGVAGGDAICQDHASAAGLPGSFGALLGDGTRAPLAALAGARGWVDPTGAPIVDRPAGWLDGTMDAPLRRDETGAEVPYARLWLGARGRACADWTSADAGLTPSVSTTDSPFTEFAVTSGCDGQARLACVERGRDVALAFPTTTGRRAFVTTTGWVPGGGLAGADAHCQAEATARAIPGAYVALLATGGGVPSARVDVTGAAWIRLDGRPLTPTALDGDGAGYLQAFLRRGDGSPPLGAPAYWAWMGAPGQTCGDWTSQAGTGRTGDASSAWLPNLYARNDYPCSEAHPLVCFEI